MTKVFISSVRRGLERERDALPGLIRAIGMEPVRFEDYSAQATPSRQACLDGINASDICLILLGANYGHRFPDTGQSPTHDEWVAAKTKAMPIIAFKKRGPEEPDKEALAREIGNYGTGVFYNEFDDADDLQAKVVAALRSDATARSFRLVNAVAAH